MLHVILESGSNTTLTSKILVERLNFYGREHFVAVANVISTYLKSKLAIFSLLSNFHHAFVYNDK